MDEVFGRDRPGCSNMAQTLMALMFDQPPTDYRSADRGQITTHSRMV